MKSKKLAALGLTAVLSLGLLTACSGGSDDTNETPAGSTPPVTESGAPAADSPANLSGRPGRRQNRRSGGHHRQ